MTDTTGELTVETVADLTLYTYGGYAENDRIWDFMALSYAGGHAYKDGIDTEGASIFQGHKKESDNDSLKRKERSSVPSYCRFFIQRFHGYFAGAPPVRKDGSKEWDSFKDNATGSGDTWEVFVREWQFEALKKSPTWARIDTPIVVPASLAEQQEAGVQPMVSLVDPRNVVDYQLDSTGKPSRIVIREVRRKKNSALDPEGEDVVYTEWTEKTIRRWMGKSDAIDVDEKITVEAFRDDEAKVNGFGFVPFVPLHFFRPESDNPMFSPSMIHDVANWQRDIFRVLSLYYEEIFNRTFTTQVVAGMNPEELASQIGQTLIATKNHETKVTTAGADPEQANSLLDALHWQVRQLFRVAQFEASGDTKESRTAESGIKKTRDLEGLYTVLSGFAERAEAAERRLIDMWNAVSAGGSTLEEGAAKGPAISYPREFDVRSIADDLEQLQAMVLSDFPTTFLAKVRSKIMTKYMPSLTRSQLRKFEQEMEDAEAEAARVMEEAAREAMTADPDTEAA